MRKMTDERSLGATQARNVTIKRKPRSAEATMSDGQFGV